MADSLTAMQNNIDNLTDRAELIPRLVATVDAMEHRVGRIAELVYEGNGQPPLMSRYAEIVKDLDWIKGAMQQGDLNRWAVLGAFVAAIFSLIIAIATAVMLSR
jgi:hypothetical protein